MLWNLNSKLRILTFRLQFGLKYNRLPLLLLLIESIACAHNILNTTNSFDKLVNKWWIVKLNKDFLIWWKLISDQ